MTHTLDSLLRQNKLSMRVMRSRILPDGRTEHDCYLSYRPGNGQAIGEMKTTYTMGSAYIDPPTRSEVAYAILSDSSTLDGTDGFEDWAVNFGYDSDSRRAEAIYQTVIKQDSDMRRLFGSDYDLYVTAERDD